MPSGRTGLRYLWTDAFGLVLLVSLYAELAGKSAFSTRGEWLVAEVERVLGPKRGIRIGEEPTATASISTTFPCLTRSACVGPSPAYRERGIALARAIHEPFLVVPARRDLEDEEDLSGPYPGYDLAR